MLVAVWLFVLCSPAWAHARMLEASPNEGATLASPPEQVELRFSEEIEAAFEPVKVFDEAGNRVDRQDTRVASADPEVLLAPVRDLSKGTYTVEYRVTSRDGHVVDGEYDFTVRAADSGTQNTGASSQGEARGGSSEGSGAQPETESSSFSLLSSDSAMIFGVALLALLGLAGLALTRRNRGNRR